jgi:BirA family biotin operon repressor/biotin-[acetyl-CoA-carboxylase] ligase
MFRGRKLGGILTEMKAQPDKLDFLIVGIGVNVNTPAERLPVMAVSMKELSGADVDRPGFAKEMLFELETDYAKFVADGFKALREECKAMSSVIGNKVRIVQQNRITEGVAEDIDEIGALIVRDSGSGEARRILSGDVGM